MAYFIKRYTGLLHGLKDNQLSYEQKSLLHLLEDTNEHIFVTGKAGSGKSTVLREFNKTTKKRVVVAAPTGVAALNANGQTIHSLFRLSMNLELSFSRIDKVTRNLLGNIDVLIIDEISMVRVDLMDAIDKSLKKIRNSELPFGGVKLIMFGDMYQLPPIVSDSKQLTYLNEACGGIYFFNAMVWRSTKLRIYELNEVFRQSDDKFRNILNEIRIGKVSAKSLNILNSRFELKLPKEDIITLASTNSVVNRLNEDKLKALTTKEYLYKAKNDWFRKDKKLNNYDLRLKVGAQVMFTRNDSLSRYVNGTIGVVTTLRKRRIRVRVGNKVYEVARVNWPKIEYVYNSKWKAVEEKTINLYAQYPLRLAWAVTIHKSQGQTYKTCAVDLKHGVFTSGQAYVALSRCESLNGLYLLSPIMQSDISVDPKIINFMSKSKKVADLNLGSNLNKQSIKGLKLRLFKFK